MNEPQDIEDLLKIILAFSEGIADAETIDKIKSLAGKLKENPDYNKIKTLEYAIRSIFDKIYERCPYPRLNYTVTDCGIMLEDGYFIYCEPEKEIQIHKDAKCFMRYTFDKDTTKQALKNYIGQQLVNGVFVLRDFIEEMNKFAPEKFTYDHIKKIIFK